MENFINFLLSTVIADAGGISLNFDIFETGLINIILLIIIIFSAGKDFLLSLLEERKTAIINSIQDAQDRLNEANHRLDEAQKQLSQADIVIDQIKTDTIRTKTVLLESEAYESKRDLITRFSRALATFKTKERQIFLEIKQEIIFLVLKRTVIRVQEIFGSKEKAIALMDETINKLEGDLL